MSQTIQQQLQSLLSSATHEIKSVTDLIHLDSLRIKYLGKKGQLTEILKGVGKLPASEKPQVGKAVNEIKTELQTALKQQETQLREQALQVKLANETIDVTLAGRCEQLGSIHPITQTRIRIEQIFSAMGFQIAEGPEIEDEHHNFDALNIPQDHPARAMQDTFYIGADKLLRTHTSPVQIREMKRQGAPIRLIAMGRVFRPESDQTHSPMFHQVEGLLVDRSCTFANLKQILQEFLTQFFQKEMTLRFRPSYFPFTEPSAEVDIYRPDKKAWLELLGCGMVHPNVLRNAGVDPDEYSGLAFGIGLDRLTMMRYGISDLRLLFENDIRFLQQF